MRCTLAAESGMRFRYDHMKLTCPLGTTWRMSPEHDAAALVPVGPVQDGAALEVAAEPTSVRPGRIGFVSPSQNWIAHRCASPTTVSLVQVDGHSPERAAPFHHRGVNGGGRSPSRRCRPSRSADRRSPRRSARGSPTARCRPACAQRSRAARCRTPAWSRPREARSRGDGICCCACSVAPASVVHVWPDAGTNCR